MLSCIQPYRPIYNIHGAEFRTGNKPENPESRSIIRALTTDRQQENDERLARQRQKYRNLRFHQRQRKEKPFEELQTFLPVLSRPSSLLPPQERSSPSPATAPHEAIKIPTREKKNSHVSEKKFPRVGTGGALSDPFERYRFERFSHRRERYKYPFYRFNRVFPYRRLLPKGSKVEYQS